MQSKRSNPVARLAERAASFGAEAASQKIRLLDSIAATEHLGARDLAHLFEVLSFLQAYPDNPAVRGRAQRLLASLRTRLDSSRLDGDSALLTDIGFPGAVNRQDFSLPVLQHLNTQLPGCIEIDWDNFDEFDSLLTVLGLCVTPGECQGLDDIRLDLSTWFELTRPAEMESDLAYLIHLFENADLSAASRDVLFELAAVPVRFRSSTPGSARSELSWPVDRVHYQKRDFGRERFALAKTIARPFEQSKRLSPAAGARFVDLALRTLFTRNLEIRTLTYANPRDVWLLSCGRGVQVGLIGVVPRYRDPLECHTCVLILKNGIPIAYGPATATLGCCEIGLNLFPEVRGAEIRFLYPQFMRAIHHVLGARYFYLTSYGMGDNNPAAIRTGAFWFYRKLGFSAVNPEVEALARAEEVRMRSEPGYRSDRKMLRRLSHTEAYCDLSDGEYRIPNLGTIGIRQSRFIAGEFGSDRGLAERRCITRAARVLGEADPTGCGWPLLAPLICMIPDLESWSRRDKARLLRIVRAKGASAESGVDRMICTHSRFREAMLSLGED